MALDVVLGLQWGDEGKGKIVDVLAGRYPVVARFQGGPNAGHSLHFEGQSFVLRSVPSGIFRKDAMNIVGNGVVLDPITFKGECENIEAKTGTPVKERIVIAKKAHLILPTHRLLDAANEAAMGKGKIGSTLKGIGPTYTDKVGRVGLRVGDILAPDFADRFRKLKDRHVRLLSQMGYECNPEAEEAAFMEAVEYIKGFRLVDCEYFVNKELEDKDILAEGAQGSMLDIDYGSYPFVTSSSTACAGACIGLGVNPHKIGHVYGIFKAYCTRVGSGPFPTELFDETGEKLRKIGNEFGAVTGRPRRCGWLDLVALKYAVMISGVTDLIMMKSDCLDTFETIKVCTSYKVDGKETDQVPFDTYAEVEPVYTEFKGWNTDLTGIRSEEELPQAFKDYIKFMETYLGVPITIISLGPDREATIMR
jgi:adenylosuccinate synthase